MPTGPQAQRAPKEARPVCSHAIAPVWDQLGKKIYEHFDSIGLKWTSIDPVRFAEVEDSGSLIDFGKADRIDACLFEANRVEMLVDLLA